MKTVSADMLDPFGPENIAIKKPEDAKKLEMKTWGFYRSPFKSAEELKKVVEESKFVVKALFEQKRKTTPELSMDVSFYVHGLATQGEVEYWVVECSGFDECHQISVFSSEATGTVVSEKFEPANSGRFTMSRCPENRVGILFIPSSYKTIQGVDGKEMHNLAGGS